MAKEDILHWSTEMAEDSEFSKKKKNVVKKNQNKLVYVYDEKGELIETVPFSEGKWPVSTKGVDAWVEETVFRFQFNDVNVWYSKETYEI